MSGLHCLDDIRDRCVIDGACWHWRGAYSSDRRTPATYLPQIGRTTTVVRAVLILTGKPPAPGEIVWRSCWTATCCAPGHMRKGNRTQYGEAVKASGLMKGRPAVHAANFKISRKHIKVSPELSREIRESDEPCIAMGRRLGLGTTTIIRHRRKGGHKTGAANSSVFSWRGIAA